MPTLALNPQPTLPSGPAKILSAWRSGDPLLFGFGLFCLALMLPTGFAALTDERLFNDVGIWRKVLKFELSIAVFVLTLALYTPLLTAKLRNRRGFQVFRALVVATLVYEIAVIAGAAVLGTASHFNPTPLGQVLYAGMGACAVFFTAATAVYAWGIARNRAGSLSPPLKSAVALGLALTFPLTLLTAGAMSAMGGHHMGASESDAGGFLLFSWSRTAGDLRVPHFFATHAMQIVPLFGLIAERLWGRAGVLPVRLSAAGFALFVLYTFAAALRGMPFLPFLG